MTNKHFTLYSVHDIIIIENIFVTIKEVIIYNGEAIDTAKDTYEAVDLVKQYRIAFRSGNVWYRRGK